MIIICNCQINESIQTEEKYLNFDNIVTSKFELINFQVSNQMIYICV